MLARAAALLDKYWLELPGGEIGPRLGDEEIRASLASMSFDEPVPIEIALDRSFDLFSAGMVRCGHPRYFGLYVPAPSFAGAVGEMIAGGLNPQLAAVSHAPAAVAAEQKVVRAFAERLGLGAGAGHFTSGGSEANMAGVLVALTRAFPDHAQAGLAAFAAAPVFYVSRDAHGSWIKIAHQLGIGRGGVRTVATDGAGRMDPERLRQAILRDRGSGEAPFLVVATAGTTNAGMIDPLPECANAAREQGLWLHVDAAWGGGVVASDRLRRLLDGIEQADSVTIDPHKLLSMPMGCGLYLSKHAHWLGQAFACDAAYMPPPDGPSEPYSSSPQWSRRFIGLKLFLSLACVGWRGHGEAVDHQIAMAQRLRRLLEANGFDVLNESPLGVLCFLPGAGCDADEFARRVQARGRCWISAADFEGARVLRACVTSFRTGPADLEALVEELRLVLA